MSLYKDRQARGLCGSCGEPSPNGGLCNVCKQKAKDKSAAKREKSRASGLCIGNCGRVPESGTRCNICKANQRTSRVKIVAKRKSDGMCINHKDRPAKPGTTMCQECIDKRTEVSNERYYQNKAAGVCRFCGKPPDTEGGSLCVECRQKEYDYRKELKAEVLDKYGGPVCVGCDNKDIETLEIDHIEGGGRKHFREEGITGGYNFYLWLRRNNYPPGYRVLCPTCNKKAHMKIPFPNQESL